MKRRKSVLFLLAVLGILSCLAGSGDEVGTTGAGALSPGDDTCPAQPLGTAGAFSLFVLGDLETMSSDVQGRVFVGGDANLAYYQVGTGLQADPGRIDLMVRGDLTFHDGSVPRGTVSYGGSVTLHNVDTLGASLQAPPPFDVDAARAELEGLSDALAMRDANGSAAFDGDALVLTGTSTGLNVFQLPSDQFSGAHLLRVHAPEGSTVVVNVLGTSARIGNLGIEYDGADPARTLFNFPQATHIELFVVSFEGNLLAPRATLDFTNGQFHGQLVVDAFSGPGQVAPGAFLGCVPPRAAPARPVEVADAGSPAIAGGIDSGAGCTRTIAYWKAHAGRGPQPDQVTPLLPIDLGTAGGEKTFVVDSASKARAVLSQQVYGTPSNGLTRLEAQILAAKLNLKSGADGSAVAPTLAEADAFLATHDLSGWSDLPASDQAQVLSWKDALDAYQSGDLGPGNCD